MGSTLRNFCNLLTYYRCGAVLHLSSSANSHIVQHQKFAKSDCTGEQLSNLLATARTVASEYTDTAD